MNQTVYSQLVEFAKNNPVLTPEVMLAGQKLMAKLVVLDFPNGGNGTFDEVEDEA